ncbi:kinase binding protein CGI-121-domain-containing protein [Flagelloscypha sp. PMI_526]|nr:kinase binding protein CGI-121-domain-containing protein [Flagelloscypha sp. PMI_526]
MESFPFAHCDIVAHLVLYTNVKNASDLRKRIVAAATAESDDERNALNFAFVEAKLITSVRHIQTAILQAILAQAHGSLRTKTIHSEILWSLNPSHNISEAIRRYGVSEDTTSLLVIRLDPLTTSVPEEVHRLMDAAVSGQIVPLSQLSEITDWAAVKKYGKLNTDPAILSTKGSIDLERTVVDKIVTSTVAMKSVSV